MLKARRACWEARKWAKKRTLAQAWAQCRRADWMTWLADAAGVGPRADAACQSVNAPRTCSCGTPECIGSGRSSKAAAAIRKAIPLSVIRAGLKRKVQP